jgi:hypothetical protein
MAVGETPPAWLLKYALVARGKSLAHQVDEPLSFDWDAFDAERPPLLPGTAMATEATTPTAIPRGPKMIPAAMGAAEDRALQNTSSANSRPKLFLLMFDSSSL